MPGHFTIIGRRHFLAGAAVGAIGAFLPSTAVSAATVPPSGPAPETTAVTAATEISTSSAAGTFVIGAAVASTDPSGDTTIRPFKFHASDEQLADLKRRIKATKWPDREYDPTQGVGLTTIQKLADYWANHHDWRRAEAQINSYPNFVTNIDGLDIHFIHVKSKHPNALPVIITHGWPGSIIEQLKIIGPLTDPTAYGGKAEDAFDVVIPSMPGYGYSAKPTSLGWGPSRIAYAWVTLMKRLGYEKFLAQGGDWGGLITDVMAVQSPNNVMGMATNMPATVPAEIA